MNKNDHRVIGEKLEYFSFANEVGKGLPLLLPKGAKLRRLLENFIIDLEESYGYDLVYTPNLGREYLYETSGHLNHYREDMYPHLDINNDNHFLRPMTCPHHFMVFDSKPRSFRDLPQRYSEISTLYRKEKSGGLYGLVRLMEFHLSDGHVFCTLEQVEEEFQRIFDMIEIVMEKLNLRDKIHFRLSLRDKESDKYAKGDEIWDKAESILLEFMKKKGYDFKVEEGHAAFYGPKIDIQIETIHGKEETIFTNQLDMFLAKSFDITYKNERDEDIHPVVIHRSIIGCIERTMALLLEVNEGALPYEFSPEQVRIIPVSPLFYQGAQDILKELKDNGIRVKVDDKDYSFGKKIRDAKVDKIPYMIIIGEKEINDKVVSVQEYNKKGQLIYKVEEFIEYLANK